MTRITAVVAGAASLMALQMSPALAQKDTRMERGIYLMDSVVACGRSIREGVSKDGSPLKPPMAFGWYKNINEADMKAMIAYLRSIKPQAFGGS